MARFARVAWGPNPKRSIGVSIRIKQTLTGILALTALVLDGPIGGTVVRATQFHEFAAQMLDRKGLLVIAPKMLSQPIALREVAGHLADLAHAGLRRMAPELAAPKNTSGCRTWLSSSPGADANGVLSFLSACRARSAGSSPEADCCPPGPVRAAP